MAKKRQSFSKDFKAKVTLEALREKKGGFTMDDVIARIENRGKEEIILRLIESNAGTIEQIAEWVKLPVEEVKKIAQKVPVMG